MEKVDSLQFESIISTTSHYGVVWKALYKGNPCAVKMVILTSGLHYDHKTKKYRHGDHGEKYFSKDERAPFNHTLYKERKAMTQGDFDHEVSMIKQMSRMNLAPQLFDAWVDKKRPMHYGLIVMELMPETIKSILLKRDLSPTELKYVRETINGLHSKGICHGDLKPSNTGVTLDSHGQIDQIRFIDCAKVYETHNRERIKRDNETFQRHARDNISERVKNKNN